ncbi:MAG: amidohydrolase family protein [Bryobacterales bacterium]|jgi:uncharacterized protein|nr:amidohydrolase family protein [Bryobacterales bacterium]
MVRFLLVALLVAGALAQSPRRRPEPAGDPNLVMTIDEYEPRTGVVLPQNPVTRARYPFVDAHNHQNRCTGDCLDRLVAEMDKLNLRLMVNLSGGYGDNLRRNLAAQKQRFPDRFAIFANLDFNGLDEPGYARRVAAQLESDIRAGAQGLKFFKNFGMDLKDSSGKRIQVDDPRFDEAFEVCGRLGVPILIHVAEPKQFFEPHDKHNERWLELKQFPGRARPPDRYPSWETMMSELYRRVERHPKTRFINAHLGWLGGDLGELGRLLDKYPNMYTEVAAVLAELGRQPRFARQWFIRYQDRVLFGKDTWAPSEYYVYFRVFETADEYFDYYRKRHAFWKMYGLDLPDEVLKKLYYKNALRIIPGIDPSGYPN